MGTKDLDLNTRSENCTDVPLNKRVLMFWESGVSGCDSIPAGITHVAFTYAAVSDSLVEPFFSGDDDATLQCIALLRARCIYTLGAIGGSTSAQNMSTITDADNFASSALALTKKYRLDGLVIDDQTQSGRKVGEFSADTVLTYMTALSKSLKDENYLLSFNSFVNEVVPVSCESYRCFPSGVEDLVDWINVVTYTPPKQDPKAVAAAAVKPNGTLDQWAVAVKNATKIVVVVTAAVGQSNAGQSNEVVLSLAKAASEYGGVMEWGGTMDKLLGYPTATILLTQKLPTEAPKTPAPTPVPMPKTCKTSISHVVSVGETASSIVSLVCRKVPIVDCTPGKYWVVHGDTTCPNNLGLGATVSVCCQP
ncbi:carbohydrate-binding protein [Achlya hypogyna]|uniref:Carbohydrate-binding protein n=1 Tax=Achlya hypogyna TaxID=1202772 RepID=A0A1V9YK46_ACHHY|nr:carbohydrate-binding protein [Achlya hypogyna]